MTIDVPGDAGALLTGTPVFGSVDDITVIGRFAQNVCDDATDYATVVQRAEQTLGASTSQGVTKISSKLSGRLLPGAEALASSGESAKSALDDYAAEVERIHSDASTVQQNVGDALASIRTQAAEIERIAALIRVPAPYVWHLGAPGTLPEPQLGPQAAELDADQRERAVLHLRSMYDMPWTRAASVWHHAIADVDTAKTTWAKLIDERRDAEGRLTAALSDTPIGQLISVSGESTVSRRFTIATAISGELWGESEAAPNVAKSHPLLRSLLGSASGEQIWDAPPPPQEVAAWWAQLSEADQARLIAECPWVIGNLPGLPFEVRDAANRKMVEFYQHYPQTLSPDQLQLMADIRDILKREAQERVPNPPIQIVALDMTGDVPKAAVGYGNLDTATHTTWQVPGMNSDAHLALEGWDQSSRNLYRAQDDIVGPPLSSAVVAWLGYDTPDLPSTGDLGVLAADAAGTGATRFAAELDGAHAARRSGASGVPVVHVLAHSYGTTLATIALTLTDERYPVDSLTMLGSAGLDPERVPSYDVLHVAEVAPGQQAIYTTHASRDQLAPLGAGVAERGQPNPDAVAPFGLHKYSSVYGGALSFSSEGDPARHLKPTDGHSTIGEGDSPGLFGMSASEGHGYLDRSTQALDSVARITTGSIDRQLERSFSRTEPECSELVTRGGGLAVPTRTKCEDE